MQRKLTLTLVIALMLFPHFVETIYSPALNSIAFGFSVSAEIASQTLSCYFFAFAFGMVIWGWLCDKIGRRPTILLGLMLYTFASILAVFNAGNFTCLLVARVFAAFGAAVGSIGAQTLLRDQFKDQQLKQVFATVGMIMPLSPALGILLGSVLTHYWGYQGIFTTLASLGGGLLLYIATRLPETYTPTHRTPSVQLTVKRMLTDRYIWQNALLIALFNLCFFSYYQLGPFLFESLNAPSQWFGYTGIILAAGIGLGSGLNRYLSKEYQAVRWACVLVFLGGILILRLQTSLWFVFPMLLVVIAYGVAIPNLLAQALRDYQTCIGTAGAFLGLMYYLLLAAGLTLTGWLQNLGTVLIISSLLLGIFASALTPKSPSSS